MARSRILPRAGGGFVDIEVLEALLDKLPDVVFFVKDREARYVSVNQTLLGRSGIAHRTDILGKTAAEVFPGPLGAGYTAQDRLVLGTGHAIEERLELHLYAGGSQGWCLTWKLPLPGGRGLIGLSRDLHRPDERHPEFRRLAVAVEALLTRFDEPLRLAVLAKRSGLSMDLFERLVKQVFHLTPRQLLAKTRVDAASRKLLSGEASVADVAHACGYADHSAFTRQFKAVVGLTPREFRSMNGPVFRPT